METDNGSFGKIALSKIQMVLVAAVILVAAANLFFLYGVGDGAKKGADSLSGMLGAAEPPPAKITPKIAITELKDSACSDCYDFKPIVDSLKKLDLEIAEEKSVEFDSPEGKQLAEKYSVERVPSLILSGETRKVQGLADSWKNFGSIESDDAFVFRNTPPVYLDLASNKYLGRVELTYLLDGNCSICNKQIPLEAFKAGGIVISSAKELDSNSVGGKELIEKYSIRKIPTIFLSSGISAYEDIYKSLLELGAAEPDGTYVLRDPSPPYFDFNESRVVGKTFITYLFDKNCSACYDANLNRQILEQGYGVYIAGESYADISLEEGKKLVSDYNISLVPTMLLSGDTSYYKKLSDIWEQVGSVEKDGTYVFRNLGALQNATYENIVTGEVVKPSSS